MPVTRSSVRQCHSFLSSPLVLAVSLIGMSLDEDLTETLKVVGTVVVVPLCWRGKYFGINPFLGFICTCISEREVG